MTTLQTAFDEFILSCRADGLSKSTVDWYGWLLCAFLRAHEGAVLADITSHTMREYLMGLRQRYDSQDTISAHNRALHRFWAWSAKEYNLADPMRSIRYPSKPNPTPRAAAVEDLIAMFHAAGEGAAWTRNRALLAFLLDTGCRAGGLVTLRMTDLELNEGRAIVIEKGSKTRTVVFTALTASLLADWIKERQPVETVFYNLDTLQPLTRNGLYQVLRRMAKRAGVKGRFNPHALRHTFAREYIKAGGDLATLSKLLGHRDVSTTVSHYAVFTDAEIAEKHEQFSPVHKLMDE